ncbi:MAG TPA: hypothetical protein VFS74_03130 [Gemmatimonadales bacterium]|jgi:hypothetical protein|nr:hypothetical protein [Gemmatimonadales bacterium]
MRALPVSLFLLAATAAAASAQVGHPPDRSPYHDILPGHTILPFVGFIGGSGGPLGVGPHHGMIYGGRYDVRSSQTMELGVSVAHGTLDRLIVNPFVKLANRTTGPVDQKVTFADLTIQLNLTGGKTWNGFAPFVSLSGGMAFAGDTPADTSGYRFGNKFYVAPTIGTRVFVTSHLLLRADMRGAFWKLTYPSSYAAEPVEEPGTEQSNAVRPDGDLSDWELTPWLQVGVGYLIRW